MSALLGDISNAIPNAGLKTPQVRGYWDIVSAVMRGNHVVYQSPTGSGKTRVSTELMRWADWDLGGAEFYVNRKSLVGQTRKAFEQAGLAFGVRAADHEEAFDPTESIQIGSADTEAIRVYKKQSWQRHDCGLVVVDEGHIQKGERMQQILADHVANGAKIVMLSATPVGLRQFLSKIVGNNIELVSGGTLSDYRQCGLLVPATVRSIEQPDLSKIDRNATGEYVIDGKRKRIYTQTIVANVIDRWRRYNPDARPTMLYAPGKPESVFFCDQFNQAGVPWCHVDATEAYWNGKRYTLNRKLWEEILEKYRTGVFKGISSRFKLREASSGRADPPGDGSGPTGRP